MNRHKTIMVLLSVLVIILTGCFVIIRYCIGDKTLNDYPEISSIKSVSISVRKGDAYSRLALTPQQEQQVMETLYQLDSSSYEERKQQNADQAAVLIYVVLEDSEDGSEILFKKINNSIGYTVTFDEETAQRYSKNYILVESNFDSFIDKIIGGKRAKW